MKKVRLWWCYKKLYRCIGVIWGVSVHLCVLLSVCTHFFQSLTGHNWVSFWDSFEIQTSGVKEMNCLKRTSIGCLIKKRVFRWIKIYDLKIRLFGSKTAKLPGFQSLKTYISNSFWDSFEIQTSGVIEMNCLKGTSIGCLIK